tara:strand:+ start:2806 stop:3003 length:198 start_codon:yes stop_codon:yes gene_type:complete
MRTLHELRLIQLEERKKAEKKSLNKLAPEMLDTLKWVKGWMEQYTTQNDTIKRVSDMIDKAEGSK